MADPITLASLATMATQVGAVASGIGAVRGLFTKSSSSSAMPTPILSAKDTPAEAPDRSTPEVAQSADRARQKAVLSAQSQETNLTKGLSSTAEDESQATRTRKRVLGA